MTVYVTYILCLCAVSVMGYLQVRINRLHIKDISRKETTFEVEYFYVAGDTVDVWCLKSQDNSNLKLSYKFGEDSIGGNGNITQITSSYNGYVGLITKLTSTHNGKSISCQCNVYSINVKFVEQESFDDFLDLKINFISSRYLQTTRLRDDGSYFLEYAFMRREPVIVECQTIVKGVVLETYKNNKLINNTAIEDISEDNLKVGYVVRNDSSTLRIVNVTLYKNFHHILYDGESLTLNTTGSVLEVYEHRSSRLVYYDYEDGEILVLNCSTLPGVLKRSYQLFFDGTVERHKDDIIKQFQLSSVYENKTVNCFLVKNIDNSTVRQIRIFFRKKTVTSLDSEYWLLPAAALVTCIVILVISAAVYCVRRRKSLAEGVAVDNSEVQLYENSTAIPAHPPQWESQYDLPTNQEQDDALYSEVQRYGPGLYPRVGSSSTEKDTVNELVYADLDMSSSDQVPKRFNCEESPYAEIHHDNARL